MTGILDLDIKGLTMKSVLLRWDPVTGIATLVKSTTVVIFSNALDMLVSDFTSGNMYVFLRNVGPGSASAIAKIAPDGTVLAQTSVRTSSYIGQEMLLDGNKLFVPGVDRALVFDADTLTLIH